MGLWDCLNQESMAKFFLYDFRGYVDYKNVIYFSFILLAPFFLEPSCHVVRKLKEPVESEYE